MSDTQPEVERLRRELEDLRQVNQRNHPGNYILLDRISDRVKEIRRRLRELGETP